MRCPRCDGAGRLPAGVRMEKPPPEVSMGTYFPGAVCGRCLGSGQIPDKEES
jgi:hypothetical protein